VKALVVIGHPAPGSFCRALADKIRETWSTAGCEVRFHDLVEEGFDPRLTAAEARGQASTDPLVLRHSTELRDSDLLAVVHPNCWGAPPAIVKGWIDRVFAPDAAYGFAKGVDQGDVPVGLLTTKAALIVNTGNTPPEREHEAFGDPLERMWRDCILSYCGVRHVMRSLFGVVATSSEDERRRWLVEVAALADKAALTVIPTGAKRSGGTSSSSST
jgi:NAD(P)H dehydrogenase (quinone)